MLKIEKIADYLRVTGYPDGSDWIFRPDDPRHELERIFAEQPGEGAEKA